MGDFVSKDSAFRLAGQLQQTLLERSPYKTGRRFLHAQWCWALGHIGLLHQLIRWFQLRAPLTQLFLVAQGSANAHFLQALAPHVTIIPTLGEHAAEAMHNAVYFGCPDGIHSLVNFYKEIERECAGRFLLELPIYDQMKVDGHDGYLAELGVKRPYVALHARYSEHDPKRNVSLEEIDTALAPFLDRGYSVISTGLDNHPINQRYASVLRMVDFRRASFLLSAACDQFVGSNSGAWTIAHAYGRPVTIMNDYERAAWIYP